MTKVYGYSDDNVCWDNPESNEFDEVGCWNEDVIITFSDSTIIRVGYSKKNLGVWWIEVEHEGNAEHSLTICEDENAEIYSDIFEIDAEVVSAYPTSERYPLGKPWGSGDSE